MIATLYFMLFTFVLFKFPSAAIYSAILVGIFEFPLNLLAQKHLELATITIYPLDVLVLLLVCVFITRSIFKKEQNAEYNQAAKYLRRYWIGLSITILWVSIIGILKGNAWQSVFRESKFVLYFIAFFPILEFLDCEKKLKAVIKILIIATTVATGLNYAFRVFGLQGEYVFASGIAQTVTKWGTFKRGYVWGIFEEMIVFSLLFSLFVGSTMSKRNQIVLLILAFFNLVNITLTFSRSSIGATVGSVFFIILGHLFYDRTKFRRKAFFHTVIFFLIIGVATYQIRGVSNIIDAVEDRFYSVFNPDDYGNPADAANREFRIQAVSIALKFGSKEPFGMGLGGSHYEAYLSHSLYSWIFYRCGIVGGIIILLVLIGLVIKLARISIHLKNRTRFAYALGCLAVFVIHIINGFGANLLFRNSSGLFLAVFFSAAILKLYQFDKQASSSGSSKIDRSERTSILKFI